MALSKLVEGLRQLLNKKKSKNKSLVINPVFNLFTWREKRYDLRRIMTLTDLNKSEIFLIECFD